MLERTYALLSTQLQLKKIKIEEAKSAEKKRLRHLLSIYEVKDRENNFRNHEIYHNAKRDLEKEDQSKMKVAKDPNWTRRDISEDKRKGLRGLYKSVSKELDSRILA